MKGFKYFSALALFVLLSTVTVQAATPEDRLLQALGKFTLSNWSIVIVDEAAWQQHHAATTQTAYTDINSRVTHIRESYVENANLADLRFTLLHEAGHIDCKCNIEEMADKFARSHQ